MIKESKGGVENPQNKIGEQISLKYGRFAYVQSFEENDGVYHVKLGFKIPRTFDDARMQKVYYKHLVLDNIADLKIDYSDNSLMFRGPEPSEVSERVSDRIESLERKFEDDLIPLVAEELVELPEVMHEFSKVKKLVRILKAGKQSEINDFIKKEKNSALYIDLFEELELIDEKKDGVYVESNKLKQIHEDYENEAYKEVVRRMVTEKPSYLRDLDLRTIWTYIRLLESYYFMAYQANSRILVDINQLKERYDGRTGNPTERYSLRSKLDDLAEKNLLNKKDEGFYEGSEKIFRDLEESVGVVMA